MRRRVVETGRDRRATAAEAGYGRLSLVSVFAGVLSGAGLFGILEVSTIAVAHRLHWHGELIDTPGGEVRLAGGLVTAGVLLFSFFFGGYVAGRTARRAGATHGIGVFVLGAAGAFGAGAIVASLNSLDLVARTLHKADLPVTRTDWQSSAGLTVGLVCLGAMFVGSFFGAIRGDRWHGRLVTRAAEAEGAADADAATAPDDSTVVDTREAAFDEAVVRGGRVDQTGRVVSLEEERELEREGRS